MQIELDTINDALEQEREDIALSYAIAEGIETGYVTRKEVFALLSANQESSRPLIKLPSSLDANL